VRYALHGCDAETKTGIVYDTRDPRYQSSGITIPRCDDCATHIETGNTTAFGMLGLGGGGILLIAIGYTNGWPIAAARVSIRTTNPRFANELRERNGHLLGR
jgi:hypothetical protein